MSIAGVGYDPACIPFHPVSSGGWPSDRRATSTFCVGEEFVLKKSTFCVCLMTLILAGVPASAQVITLSGSSETGSTTVTMPLSPGVFLDLLSIGTTEHDRPVRYPHSRLRDHRPGRSSACPDYSSEGVSLTNVCSPASRRAVDQTDLTLIAWTPVAGNLDSVLSVRRQSVQRTLIVLYIPEGSGRTAPVSTVRAVGELLFDTAGPGSGSSIAGSGRLPDIQSPGHGERRRHQWFRQPLHGPEGKQEVAGVLPRESGAF